jgi:electron transfer flavoprotein beta subunit
MTGKMTGMKILVCVKQVPDTESPLEIDAGAQWIRIDNRIAFRMNRYDEYALEEALLIKEARGGVIDAISVGPPRVESVLKKSLEKGADNGIHILLDSEGYISPGVTSSFIADWARDRRYDLILAGAMAEDDMQCQVGPLIAARLGIHCATAVVRKDIDRSGGAVSVDCELEGGMIETMMIPLPALLTIQTGINRPRYPSLSNVLRAKGAVLTRVDAPGHGSAERLTFLSYPQRAMKGIVLDGTPQEKAVKLIAFFHEHSLL